MREKQVIDATPDGPVTVDILKAGGPGMTLRIHSSLGALAGLLM